MPTPRETARELLEFAPLVMRTLRREIRERQALDLSVPQFRTLGYLHRHSGVSLSDVTEHIGLTLPSMSKLVDGLVERRLVSRQTFTDDRRRVMLALTPRGRALLEAAYASTQATVAERLASLNDEERMAVVRAMRLLHPLFSQEVRSPNGHSKD